MSNACFHAEKPTKHSKEHMNRKSKVGYLVDHTSVRNEYWENKKLPGPEEFVKLAPIPYAKRVKQKMQKTQLKALIKEAVVNLNEDHTLKDVKRMMFVINKTLGGHVPFRIAVHKDEGVFVEYVGKSKNEWTPNDYIYKSKNFKWYEKSNNGEVGREITDIMSYRPSRDYHYNEADKEWYEDEEFTKKADLSNKHIYYNYHAHVLYSAFDLNTGKGRSIRKDMRSLQTLVANSLQMQRGQKFSNTKRKNHWQRKEESDLLNDEKREHQKTKQKSNEIVHENSINKNQALLRERLFKESIDDLRKLHPIEYFRALLVEQKRLHELLNISDDISIEEGIQKIKEESQKIIDELKVKIEEKSKIIEDQNIFYEKQISELDKKVEALNKEVYSERIGYVKGKKTEMKLTFKRLVVIKERKIEKLTEEILELKDKLNKVEKRLVLKDKNFEEKETIANDRIKGRNILYDQLLEKYTEQEKIIEEQRNQIENLNIKQSTPEVAGQPSSAEIGLGDGIKKKEDIGGEKNIKGPYQNMNLEIDIQEDDILTNKNNFGI